MEKKEEGREKKEKKKEKEKKEKKEQTKSKYLTVAILRPRKTRLHLLYHGLRHPLGHLPEMFFHETRFLPKSTEGLPEESLRQAALNISLINLQKMMMWAW
jgi:hypothetical protein